jgi:hypothetical protein
MKKVKTVTFDSKPKIIHLEKKISNAEKQKAYEAMGKAFGHTRFWRLPPVTPSIVVTDSDGHSTISGKFV